MAMNDATRKRYRQKIERISKRYMDLKGFTDSLITIRNDMQKKIDALASEQAVMKNNHDAYRTMSMLQAGILVGLYNTGSFDGDPLIRDRVAKIHGLAARVRTDSYSTVEAQKAPETERGRSN